MENSESIGMMAGAYFVGRLELLRWINDLTGLNYSKIEQTASGIFACHVFHALFPDEIRFEKVNFNARQNYDFVHNYKILQACFNRKKLKKKIDVEKLMKGKYQDNLEFIQWIKAYYDMNASEEALNYDGRACRDNILSRVPASRRPALTTNRFHPNERSKRANTKRAPVSRSNRQVNQRPTPRSVLTVKKSEFDILKANNEELETSLSQCESEREFYFNKLRKVEVIIQSVEDELKEGEDNIDILLEAFEDVKKALYAEDDVDLPVDNEEPLQDMDDKSIPNEGEILEDEPLPPETGYENELLQEHA